MKALLLFVGTLLPSIASSTCTALLDGATIIPVKSGAACSVVERSNFDNLIAAHQSQSGNQDNFVKSILVLRSRDKVIAMNYSAVEENFGKLISWESSENKNKYHRWMQWIESGESVSLEFNSDQACYIEITNGKAELVLKKEDGLACAEVPKKEIMPVVSSIAYRTPAAPNGTARQGHQD
ncbi:MAG: hypothetical protein ABIR96_11880 [Bdellovibrionota bacterium]